MCFSHDKLGLENLANEKEWARYHDSKALETAALAKGEYTPHYLSPDETKYRHYWVDELPHVVAWLGQ